MCVLASAVDIVILTHREAVTGYPAGHRLASFYTLSNPRNSCSQVSLVLLTLSL